MYPNNNLTIKESHAEIERKMKALACLGNIKERFLSPI